MTSSQTPSPEFRNAVYSSSAQPMSSGLQMLIEADRLGKRFLVRDAAAGTGSEKITVRPASPTETLNMNGRSDLVAHRRHDGLMDF